MGNFVPPPTHFPPGFSTWLDPRSRESCQVPAETLAVGSESQTLCMLQQTKSAIKSSPLGNIGKKNVREAGNRSHLRTSASLPISSSPREDTFTFTDSKAQVFYQEQSSPSLNAELLGISHSFWLMSVFAISLFSLMLSPRIH